MYSLIVRIIHRIFTALGLAPYKIIISSTPTRTSRPTAKFVYSKFGCVYNILLLLYITSLFCYVIPNYVTENLDSLEEKVGKSALATMGNTSAFIIIICSTIYQRKFVKLYNQLCEFDQRVPSQLDNEKFPLTFEVFSIILLWLGLLITEGFKFYVWHFLIHVPNSIVCCWLVIHYCLTVNVLRMKFQVINELISAIDERPLDHLPGLRAARNFLWKITYGFSKFYSLPVLFAIGNLLLDAIIGVYYCVTRALGSSDPYLAMGVMNGFFWGSVQICPIIHLTIAIKRLTQEIDETSSVLYALSAKFIEDEDVLSWINEFSLELFHRKISFTAYGLFSLDCSLLFSVISTLVTYEIIAVKFDDTGVERHTSNISNIL